MGLSLHYELRAGYLYIRTTGVFDPASAKEVLLEWTDEARRLGVDRVLCDIRKIEGLDHGAPSMWSRFETNEFVALSLPKKMRLSVWATPQQIAPDGFDENVMVNRGAAVRVTSELEDALLWLGVEQEMSKEGRKQELF